MKVYMRLPYGEIFELDVLKETQVPNLKETVATRLACTHDNLELSLNGKSLWSNSTVEQNGIYEFSVVDVIPLESNDIQDNMNEPLSLNLAIESTDPAAAMAETTCARTAEATGSSAVTQFIILPERFDGSRVLAHTSIHHFRTGGQLAMKISSDSPAWVNKLEAYAFLSNSEIFCADDADELSARGHGHCVLVNSSEYTYLLEGPGYQYQEGSSMNLSAERFKRRYKIGSDVTIDMYEIKGDLWTRRRFVLTGDDTHSFIQWLRTKPKKKHTTTKAEISTVKERLEKIENSVVTLSAELSDVIAQLKLLQSTMGEATPGSSISSVLNQLTVLVNTVNAQLSSIRSTIGEATPGTSLSSALNELTLSVNNLVGHMMQQAPTVSNSVPHSGADSSNLQQGLIR